MRVRWLQVAADLAASYSGYTLESGTRARLGRRGPLREPSGTGKGTDVLAALLLFPPAPAAGAGAALGAVLLLTGLWVKYTSTAHALFELGSLTDHRRKVSIH